MEKVFLGFWHNGLPLVDRGNDDEYRAPRRDGASNSPGRSINRYNLLIGSEVLGRMELRHLRYFVAVAETLHFGQAAARLEIAQPSLSHQIRQLEDELQTSLLRRTKRRVELTEAGRLFLAEAREIIARADRAAVIARRVGRTDAQRLRVAVGFCMDHAEVAACVGDFNVTHDDIQIELRTMSVPAQLTALADGRLDVGFVRPPIVDTALTSEVLVREPVIVAFHPKHRFKSRRMVPLRALANEPFVFVVRDAVPVFHDFVLRMCREAGFVPNAPHEVDHLQMMLAMVAAGSGIALVPSGARHITQHRIVYRPLDPSEPALETHVAWRREDTSPVVAQFVDVVRRSLGRARNNRRT
jgi:DNA-binding transcriptional LysR family regulator